MEIKNKNFSHKTFSDWGCLKHSVSQESILGPLFFLLCLNDLSKTINGKSKSILFTCDTSIIFTNSNLQDFKNDIKIEFESQKKWFKANRLLIIIYKTHFMQFTIKTTPQIDLDFSYANKLNSKFYDTKFLGMYVDSTLPWKNHVEQITHKLSAACNAMRSVKPFMSQETLKMVYYPYFHSITSFGLIFWGKSSHSALIFKIKKNMTRIIRECRRRDSCRDLFKNLKVLPLQLQYILSLL